MNTISYIQKRDGSVVPFDKKMITHAITKSFDESNEGNRFIASKITESVLDTLARIFPELIPSVEEIQDVVEDTLISYNFKNSAKEYIRYRHDRNKQRVSV